LSFLFICYLILLYFKVIVISSFVVFMNEYEDSSLIKQLVKILRVLLSFYYVFIKLFINFIFIGFYFFLFYSIKSISLFLVELVLIINYFNLNFKNYKK